MRARLDGEQRARRAADHGAERPAALRPPSPRPDRARRGSSAGWPRSTPAARSPRPPAARRRPASAPCRRRRAPRTRPRAGPATGTAPDPRTAPVRRRPPRPSPPAASRPSIQDGRPARRLRRAARATARPAPAGERAATIGETGCMHLERRAERLGARGERDEPAGLAHDQLPGGDVDRARAAQRHHAVEPAGGDLAERHRDRADRAQAVGRLGERVAPSRAPSAGRRTRSRAARSCRPRAARARPGRAARR